MRVVLAPGSFGASLPAGAAAAAMAVGWPDAERAPMSGAGFPGDLAARIASADLVVAGEEAYDATTARDGPVASVAALALDAGVPCVVLAGRVGVGRQQAAAYGVTELWSVLDHVGEPAAGQDPAAGLAALATHVARLWR